MASRQTPEEIVATRQVSAGAVLEGRADLRAYHYRHLAVLSDGTVEPERLARLMAAVEHLDAYGWELVTLSPSTDARRLIAILRRRSLG
ncbi:MULTISPECIES: transcriptional regulator [Catenuloplanes]|uniref:DUF4177 domain-containing protein n=1 Tax=Catenuloplanes niger TaxID=587534 RepID=A0AAE3ZN82_9ACTN|nr:transcriptional regulator [Catenuloplanes niger]MDR7321861.1 hypothetical protein [Catenuloplanes niger]